MKVDQHINSLLRKRRQLAEELDAVSTELDEFLAENGVNPDPSCWLGGVEIYVNPDAAEKEVRSAIQAHQR